MSDYNQVQPYGMPTYDIGNQTGCVPTVDVIAALQTMVKYQDAITLGKICLVVGFVIGVVFMHYWYKGRIKKDGS